jgi:hypothetical protein
VPVVLLEALLEALVAAGPPVVPAVLAVWVPAPEVARPVELDAALELDAGDDWPPLLDAECEPALDELAPLDAASNESSCGLA